MAQSHKIADRNVNCHKGAKRPFCCDNNQQKGVFFFPSQPMLLNENEKKREREQPATHDNTNNTNEKCDQEHSFPRKSSG